MAGVRQIGGLRRGLPLVFGDEHSELRYMERVERALQAQTSKYAVAPLVTLVLPSGRRLQSGTPLRLRDVEGWRGHDGYRCCATAAMQTLARAGRVLVRDDRPELGDEPPAPEAA
jgi:hypothetical protein